MTPDGKYLFASTPPRDFTAIVDVARQEIVKRIEFARGMGPGNINFAKGGNVAMIGLGRCGKLAIAEDGSNVPIVVSMDHPMEPDHYISSIHIVNFKDPIVSKGIYRFTPASGQAYIGTQIRMDGGDSEIFVIAECTKHGRWVASRTLKVSLGGC